MKRIMLTVAYDGTDYVGWQIQKNGVAVEEVLNNTLSRLLGEDIRVIGCSRTDSGVHARGNVAVFDTETSIPPEKISFAANQLLPEDIKIARSAEVSLDFHPRYMAKVKTYEYKIINCRYYEPTLRRYADYVYYPMDIEKMRRAASYLVGEHDFTAFSTAGGQQKTTVRTIYSIDIEEKLLNEDADPEEDSARGFRPRIFTIRVSGNGFLYNMVRIMAAAIEKAGIGVFPPEYVGEILESRDRAKSPPKARACGLTLLKIDYSENLC